MVMIRAADSNPNSDSSKGLLLKRKVSMLAYGTGHALRSLPLAAVLHAAVAVVSVV
jgi:hypothetical protein